MKGRKKERKKVKERNSKEKERKKGERRKEQTKNLLQSAASLSRFPVQALKQFRMESFCGYNWAGWTRKGDFDSLTPTAFLSGQGGQLDRCAKMCKFRFVVRACHVAEKVIDFLAEASDEEEDERRPTPPKFVVGYQLKGTEQIWV